MTPAIMGALSGAAGFLHLTHPVILTLLKITLVLLIAFAATATLGRTSASSRHLVWLIALGALLVLPPIAVWAPLPIPVLPGLSAPASRATGASVPAADLTAPDNVTYPGLLSPIPAAGSGADHGMPAAAAIGAGRVVGGSADRTTGE